MYSEILKISNEFTLDELKKLSNTNLIKELLLVGIKKPQILIIVNNKSFINLLSDPEVLRCFLNLSMQNKIKGDF
jgi:hypothetical protein